MWCARISEGNLTILALALIVVALPLAFGSSYHYRVATLVWITALAAVGLNMLMGHAGQVSLGHAGFLGLGAYGAALGPTQLGLPPLLAAGLGIVLTALLAWLVGRPILRLKGHYLAIATLGLGLLIWPRAGQRARDHGRPGRHAGRAPGDPRRAPARRRCLVLDRRGRPVRSAPGSPRTSSRGPTGPGPAGPARQRGRGRRQRRSTTAATSCSPSSSRPSMRPLAGALNALFDGFMTPDTRGLPALGRARDHGRPRRHGLDLGTSPVPRCSRPAAAPHRPARLRAGVLGLVIMLAMIFLPRGIVPSLRRCWAGRLEPARG